MNTEISLLKLIDYRKNYLKPNGKMNILFVEDSDIEQFLIESIIEAESLPIHPIFAQNGQKALQVLASIEGHLFPNAIIVDIHLPGMSGFEFIQAFQRYFFSRVEEVNIFLTSACCLEDEQDRIEQSTGITGFFEKPFSSANYRKYIQKMETTPQESLTLH